jgi:hypothetical protein
MDVLDVKWVTLGLLSKPYSWTCFIPAEVLSVDSVVLSLESEVLSVESEVPSERPKSAFAEAAAPVSSLAAGDDSTDEASGLPTTAVGFPESLVSRAWSAGAATAKKVSEAKSDKVAK